MPCLLYHHNNIINNIIIIIIINNNNRIENFIYSMLKFDLLPCTLMVCVSDRKCIELCEAAFFPCFDFQHHHHFQQQHQQREVMHITRYCTIAGRDDHITLLCLSPSIPIVSHYPSLLSPYP